MAGNVLKLIVGLGNPGAEYARTRHNAGFWLVDELARRHGGTFRHEGKHQAELARVRVNGGELWLAKPMTFMNRSGGPVSSILNFYKIAPGEMLVAHDEIDLAASKLKVKTGGGDAGQNGLRSITAALGPDYRRVRIGVGHPGHKTKVTGHVLANFSKDDLTWFKPMLDAMVEAAPLLARDDDTGFMSKVALLLAPPKPSD